MADDPIPFARPALPPWDEVSELLASSYAAGRVTLGPLVAKLESEVRQACGGHLEAVAVGSCTAGLMLTWQALGLPAGGEVICPAFTFVATVEALWWCGLKPVLVDCLPETGTIDPAAVAAAITPQTVGICPVNVFGLPPDYAPLLQTARQAGLAMVGDAAQGLGSTYQGQPTGTWANAEVFSFSPSKVITAGEGGCIVTRDLQLATRLRGLRDYGKALTGPFANEDMEHLGLSARLSEMHAAIGVLNLRRREALLSRRRQLLARYRDGLADLPSMHWQHWPADRVSAASYAVAFIEGAGKAELNQQGEKIKATAKKATADFPEAVQAADALPETFPIPCDSPRDALATALRQAGITPRRYFFPSVDRLTLARIYPFRQADDLHQTHQLCAQALALPLFDALTAEQQNRVIATIRAALTLPR